MQVDFYQLGRTSVSRVLAQIAARILSDGGRLLVVAGDDAQAAAIDEGLWEGEESFLPHGRAKADDAGADQPVLIALDCTAANAARHIALTDGRWREEALRFERAFHFFDEGSLESARAAWRGLAQADGVTRNFWRQDDETGRWGKVA